MQIVKKMCVTDDKLQTAENLEHESKRKWDFIKLIKLYKLFL